MCIFAIHGAFSSPGVFNYMRLKIHNQQWRLFDYSNDVNDFVQICNSAANEITEPCHVIGHSMGGMIALYLAKHRNIKSITTIASPLNGLDFNLAQQYFSRSSFIRELSTNGKIIRELQDHDYAVPVQHIISTRGFNPYMFDENDGVVSLKSQRGWAAGIAYEINSNHSEIMQNDECVKLIEQFVL